MGLRPLTMRALNRATLARQLLLRREAIGTVPAVRRIAAVQAQEPASPYVALWNRIADFDPADLDRAFTDHTVVKASLMRNTLHVVTADDYVHFHTAMHATLRAARFADARFTRCGLTPEQADALVPELLRFAREPRTNAEFEAMLDERLGVLPKPGIWWALRSSAPMVHAPTGAAWTFGQRPAYVAARTAPTYEDRELSLQILARRYLQAFGPASVADFAQFGRIARSSARAALTSLDDALQVPGPDDVTYFDLPECPLPRADVPAPPRLMAMWDSVLLAYHDRSRVIPAAYRKLIIRNNGDTLPTLLVDGQVAGVWRIVEGGVEATAFHPLPNQAWRALDGEAAELAALLTERDPRVYNRYGRWWATLPAAEVRMLGG